MIIILVIVRYHFVTSPFFLPSSAISSSDFEAKIWIGPEGQLERYRQGPLEIRRIHPAKNTPTSEKKTTAAIA